MPRFRRVPPAVFPSLLGLLGLVAAWYRAADVFGVPTALIDVAAGMVSPLFVFFLILYGVKLAHRPGVIIEDASILPGRTGVAALALGCMVLSSLLADRFATFATVLLIAGVLILSTLAVWVFLRRIRGTDTAGPITPAMHLVFVGFVLVPTAATPLTLMAPAMPWLLLYCTLAAGLIIVPTIGALLRAEGAPPLRPLHAIQLAPPAFIATGLFLTGFDVLGALALVWSVATGGLLLLRLAWMMEGGFSPMWAAFTFPVTAIAGALLLGGESLGMRGLSVGGGVVLILATLYIPVIVVRVLKLWMSGTLAIKTNTATA
ncbi:MAG: tellurium resistance protein [Pseudomonadota bacterium]